MISDPFSHSPTERAPVPRENEAPRDEQSISLSKIEPHSLVTDHEQVKGGTKDKASAGHADLPANGGNAPSKSIRPVERVGGDEYWDTGERVSDFSVEPEITSMKQVPPSEQTTLAEDEQHVSLLGAGIHLMHTSDGWAESRLDNWRGEVDTELQDLREQVTLLNSKKPEDEEDSLLPEDTFSFFATTKYWDKERKRPNLTFLIALGVFLLQLLTLVLLIVDVIDRDSDGNQLGIPAGVEFAVRLSQLIAIFITIISQDEVRQSLNVLYNGYDESAQLRYCGFTSHRKWYFSILSRFISGSLSIAVTFMLIMRSDSVRDLLLNFTAVEFVSSVDDVVYLLCRWGYVGQHVKEDADVVYNMKATPPPETRRKFPRTLCMLTMYTILIGFWLWLSYRQNRGDFRTQTIYVQFGDAFSPALGTFSGLYSLVSSRSRFFGDRGSYVAQTTNFAESAKFAYCTGTKTWTFTYGETPEALPANPCDSVRALSSVSLSYDIIDTAGDSWFFRDDVTSRELPLGHFSMQEQEVYFGMECRDSSDCADKTGDDTRFACVESTCVCSSGWYGLQCHFREPCETIELDEQFDGFVGTRPWSTTYGILLDDATGSAVQVYNRPVYLSNLTKDDTFDIMLFTGRRWVLTQLSQIEGKGRGIDVNRSSIAQYVANEFHGFWSDYEVFFISDPVDIRTPTDLATPVGLNWYYAVPKDVRKNGADTNAVQPPDLNRESDAVLLCAACDDEENPCFFLGVCADNGRCECTTGAWGILCQIAPVGNGRCNSYFNKPEFAYDGGDCCRGSCQSAKFHCGCIEEPVFGLNQIYIGYSECLDPEQLCDPPDDPCWKQLGETVTGEVLGAQAGTSVDVSGNGAVFAFQEAGSGITRVFGEDGSVWLPRGQPFNGPASTNATDGFPSSAVALSENGRVLAIGWPFYENGRGLVRVYRWEAPISRWRQMGEDIEGRSSGRGSFGWSVALSEDGAIVAIGSPSHGDEDSSSGGYVRAFQFNVLKDWVQIGSDLSTDGEQFDRTGWSVSLSSNGTILAIGAPNPSSFGTGGVKVHEFRTGANWTQIGELHGGSYTGYSVSLTGDGSRLAMIGDVLKNSSSRGNVTVYERMGSSSIWTQVGQQLGTSGYGAVSLSSNGTVVAVGDPRGSENGVDSGSVTVYEYNSTSNWTMVGSKLYGTGSDLFGFSTSLTSDGSLVACGAPGDSLDDPLGYVEIFLNSVAWSPSLPSESPSNETVPITLVVQLDGAPLDTGISLECDNVTYASILPGDLDATNAKANGTVQVPDGANCELTVEDAEANGICCNHAVQGWYQVYFGDDVSSDALLAQGGPQMTYRETFSFKAEAPGSVVPMTVLLALDDASAENSMHLVCGDVLKVDVPYGTLPDTLPADGVKKGTYYVPEGIECEFALTDRAGDGITNGRYEVYLGNDTANVANSLVAGDGRFGLNVTVNFEVSQCPAAFSRHRLEVSAVAGTGWRAINNLDGHILWERSIQSLDDFELYIEQTQCISDDQCFTLIFSLPEDDSGASGSYYKLYSGGEKVIEASLEEPTQIVFGNC